MIISTNLDSHLGSGHLGKLPSLEQSFSVEIYISNCIQKQDNFVGRKLRIFYLLAVI